MTWPLLEHSARARTSAKSIGGRRRRNARSKQKLKTAEEDPPASDFGAAREAEADEEEGEFEDEAENENEQASRKQTAETRERPMLQSI